MTVSKLKFSSLLLCYTIIYVYGSLNLLILSKHMYYIANVYTISKWLMLLVIVICYVKHKSAGWKL